MGGVNETVGRGEGGEDSSQKRGNGEEEWGRGNGKWWRVAGWGRGLSGEGEKVKGEARRRGIWEVGERK